MANFQLVAVKNEKSRAKEANWVGYILPRADVKFEKWAYIATTRRLNIHVYEWLIVDALLRFKPGYSKERSAAIASFSSWMHTKERNWVDPIRMQIIHRQSDMDDLTNI